MKRFLLLLLTLALLLPLVSGVEPSPIEKAQKRGVDIGEQFLEGEITAKEAKEMLESIKVPETEGYGKDYLEGDIAYLHLLISKQDATYEDIQEKIEYIKNRKYE